MHTNRGQIFQTSRQKLEITITEQKTDPAKILPIQNIKTRASIAVPIMHNYKTRAATKEYTITLPRVIARLPRVQTTVPTCQNIGPVLFKNFHVSIINYKVHTGKLP